jgi:hypothetical protein
MPSCIPSLGLHLVRGGKEADNNKMAQDDNHDTTLFDDTAVPEM